MLTGYITRPIKYGWDQSYCWDQIVIIKLGFTAALRSTTVREQHPKSHQRVPGLNFAFEFVCLASFTNCWVCLSLNLRSAPLVVASKTCLAVDKGQGLLSWTTALLVSFNFSFNALCVTRVSYLLIRMQTYPGYPSRQRLIWCDSQQTQLANNSRQLERRRQHG